MKVNEWVTREHIELTAEIERLHKLKTIILEPTYTKAVSYGI